MTVRMLEVFADGVHLTVRDGFSGGAHDLGSRRRQSATRAPYSYIARPSGRQRWSFQGCLSEFALSPISARRPRNSQVCADAGQVARGHPYLLADAKHRLRPHELVELLPCQGLLTAVAGDSFAFTSHLVVRHGGRPDYFLTAPAMMSAPMMTATLTGSADTTLKPSTRTPTMRPAPSSHRATSLAATIAQKTKATHTQGLLFGSLAK